MQRRAEAHWLMSFPPPRFGARYETGVEARSYCPDDTWSGQCAASTRKGRIARHSRARRPRVQHIVLAEHRLLDYQRRGKSSARQLARCVIRARWLVAFAVE
ncbi:hypothetical protein KCP69_25515 [Salmonella enterica subsp. enterica]|nr:hypothetical protein KCP69_25515 [Salmonella enterica subsp. enterica]